MVIIIVYRHIVFYHHNTARNVVICCSASKIFFPIQSIHPPFIIVSYRSCIAALGDVNKIYRKHESKATAVGSMALFGLTMEVGRVMNSIVTMDAFVNDETSNDVILSTALDIFNKFPTVATNRHKQSGKALIHVKHIIPHSYLIISFLTNISNLLYYFSSHPIAHSTECIA